MDTSPGEFLKLAVPQSPIPILALGGELKASFCLLQDRQAHLGWVGGSLSDPAVFRTYLKDIERLRTISSVKPELVVCDMHPEYIAGRYARTLNLPFLEVQHHYAHIVSSMVENNYYRPVIGLACDGTGYGLDGAIWGCEVLVFDEQNWSRAGHLDYFPLPGGDVAAQETWRPAAGLLRETYGESWLEEAGTLFEHLDRSAVRLIAQRLNSRTARLPRTSSLGRLFDAAAFLLGLCDRNDDEAQAPRALEAAALEGDPEAKLFPVSLIAATERAIDKSAETDEDTNFLIDFRPILIGLVEGMRNDRPVPDSARAFHRTMAEALVQAAQRTAERANIDTVALSGGCFFNRLLFDEVLQGLKNADMKVLIHNRVSPGDDGLALGQAVAAAWMKRKELS
ncbi:MAG: hypothetical protein KJ645_03165 [Planctomycetes bacterium]|nr:hypothetical protein [Planctomycetota bacterium]